VKNKVLLSYRKLKRLKRKKKVWAKGKKENRNKNRFYYDFLY